MKTKSFIYCIYVSQSVIAGEEVTVVQSRVDHHGGIGREVCSVQNIRQVHQGDVFVVPTSEGAKVHVRKEAMYPQPCDTSRQGRLLSQLELRKVAWSMFTGGQIIWENHVLSVHNWCLLNLWLQIMPQKNKARQTLYGFKCI